jgi:hypothetical protein
LVRVSGDIRQPLIQECQRVLAGWRFQPQTEEVFHAITAQLMECPRAEFPIMQQRQEEQILSENLKERSQEGLPGGVRGL